MGCLGTFRLITVLPRWNRPCGLDTQTAMLPRSAPRNRRHLLDRFAHDFGRARVQYSPIYALCVNSRGGQKSRRDCKRPCVFMLCIPRQEYIMSKHSVMRNTREFDKARIFEMPDLVDPGRGTWPYLHRAQQHTLHKSGLAWTSSGSPSALRQALPSSCSVKSEIGTSFPLQALVAWSKILSCKQEVLPNFHVRLTTAGNTHK